MEILEYLNNLHFISKEIQIFIISTLPIIELRGAIPLGHIYGLNTITTFSLAFLGSMLPVPFLLLFLNPVFKIIRNIAFFRKQIDKVTHRTLKRINKVKKFSLITLMIFVAIPIPTTGVWTGSLAASLINLDNKKAFVAILLGNLIAGIIVSFFSVTAINFF